MSSKAQTQYENMSAIGKQLHDLFKIYDIDILREDYSTTIDMPHMSEAHIKRLENDGFNVIHEDSTVYTLTYEFQI